LHNGQQTVNMRKKLASSQLKAIESSIESQLQHSKYYLLKYDENFQRKKLPSKTKNMLDAYFITLREAR